MQYCLAIDQSTSATKAVLFDLNGRLLQKASLPHKQHYPRPGWVEHDAEEIYRNTLSAVKELFENSSDPLLKDDLLSVSLTNQRETIVVFEKESGRPLYPAIVWQCRRGESICEEHQKAGHHSQVKEVTGLRIDTYFPASKLQWLFREEREIAARVRRGEALIGTIDTYLIYRLTAGEVFRTDSTNASRTLLFDIRKQRWDPDLCALFSVPPEALPEVVASDATFGRTDFNGLLNKAVPICGVMGDSQAALLAERCIQPGRAKVTFGTGSSVLLNIGSDGEISGDGAVTTIAWKLRGETIYALEGIINFTGATVAWLKDQLQVIGDPAETQEMALALEDNGGVYLVPAFVGLSAPHWRPGARAGILGLTPSSNRHHLVRAALESISYQVHDVLTLMQEESGIELDVIHADGGMISNSFLMQFTADITGLRLRASSLPELSALGSVLAGMLGSGVHRSLEALESLPQEFVDYHPQMEADKVEANRAGWDRAVQRILLEEKET